MKKLKTKIIVISLIATLLIISITTIIIATISKTSTRGQLEVSSAEITATTEYSSTSNSFAWQYNEAGEKKDISIKTTNSTDVVLHNQYNISVNGTADTNLLKAILVYYNGEFVASLSDVVNNNIDIESAYSFIPLSNPNYKTDLFEFELHEAADGSIFDNKEINITITTYSQNANYYNYIFVHSENEFKLAVDDINSGLFEETPSIVLCNTINLSNSYTLEEPTKIYMNGATLSGALTINDTDSESPNALLEILGNGTFNATVTLGSNYDVDGAKELVINHVKEVLKEDSLTGTSKNIIGYYSFYSPTILAKDNCTFSTPDLVMPTKDNAYYSKIGKVQVYTTNISFKIIGSKTELLTTTLAYMPSDGATITSDLFLPTYIPSQNASITWTSSDESIITSTGMITAERLENAEVTLYAEIKVNETIITRRYNFKVSAHNNEINFYKLVQEISPIVINNVRNSDADDDDALYHLPIVSQNSNGTFNTYDYRTSYKSPVNTKMFDWKAYKDIGLENITYSMTQQQANSYDYITLGNTNELYLNTITLNNFAQITITGDFGNNETYSTNINISISVGSNTQLLEKAFTQVSEELVDISVLGNILSTRIDDGMKNEKGDFSLSHAYLDTTTNTINTDYTIEYSGAKDIISSITYNSTTDKYDFKINPEYFNEYETTVAFTATVYYLKGVVGSETSKSRTFYVTVPAALHKDDFGTISIYNSTKYQVFSQLPSNEKAHTTGYTVGTTLTDENLDYILLRDIVGDANYLVQYDKSNGLYLEKINYTSSDYAKGTESLSYQTASTNPTSTTDTAAYDFARLIEWATGNTRALASSVVTNTSNLGNYASYKANAEDYLNDDEIKVLKEYYCRSTGATESDWNLLYSEVFNVAPGYIYTNPALLNQVIKCLSLQITGSNFRNGSSEANFSTIFGKYMEVIQRYAVSTTKVNANDVAPCQEIYNTRVVWTHTTTNDTTIGISNNAINVNGTGYTANYSIKLADGTWWQRFKYAGGTSGDGGLAGIYARAAYAADRTSYITEAELTILRIFLLNAVSQSDTTTTSYLSAQFNSTNLNSIMEVINNNQNYYSGYYSSDFDYIGEAILNAFNACLVIPTYFATDGVAKIIKSFYDKVDYELPSYGETDTTTSFVSSLTGNIPYITNADNIKSVLSYFTNLKTLTFNGNTNLAVFLSENGLSTVFARTGLYNKEITNLTMKHVAHTSVNFDLTNIKNFTKLTVLDLSNNSGIQSVNELVNVNRSKYTLVNIEQIGVEYEYQAFAIDNIASPTCTVRYTDAVNTNTYTNDGSRSSDLADLSDFNKFITKYMYMTNVIYNEDGTTSVTWRIDEGNEIDSSLITNGGNRPTFDSFDEMNQFISPYYYCYESFTYNGVSFVGGKLYKVTHNGSSLIAEVVGTYDSANSLDGNFSLDTSVPTFDSYEPELNTYYSKDTTTAGTVNYSSKTDLLLGSTYQSVDTVNKNYIYTAFSRSSDYDYTRSVTLPTESTIITAIRNANTDLDIVSVTLTTATVQVISFNRNGSSSFGDSWQHGLYVDGSLFDYSPGLVGGQNTYSFATFDKSYLGTVVRIYYNSNKGKTSPPKLYPSSPATWADSDRQFLYSVTISLSCRIRYNGTHDSSIQIDYYDGSSTTLDGCYAAGTITKESIGTTIIYTETQSTVFDYDYGDGKYVYYSGDNATVLDEYGNSVSIRKNTLLYVYVRYIYPVESRSRTYRIEGTIYTVDFWYIRDSWNYDGFNSTNTGWYHPDDHNNEESGIIDGELIEYVTINGTTYTFSDYFESLPTNSTTRTNLSGFDVDWENVPLVSEWAFDKIYCLQYLNYVTGITESSHSLLDTQFEIYSKFDSYEYLFEYEGSTTTEPVYYGNTTGTPVTYTQNYVYKLNISSNQLVWNFYSTYVTNPDGTTMDSILEEANNHFGDYHYGEYYGKYYGYSGNNFYSELGYHYESGYIYRIMPNETNTAFRWVKVSAFPTTSTSDMLLQLGTGVLKEGDIVYGTGTAFASFFTQGWYKVVVDEKTNIVNLVKFNDLGFTTNGATTYTRLTNDKLVARSGDYLGYSGTFTVQISAMIRTYNSTTGTWTEYIKTYKLKFVGSLTS